MDFAGVLAEVFGRGIFEPLRKGLLTAGAGLGMREGSECERSVGVVPGEAALL